MWDLWLTHTHQPAIVVADDMGIFAALDERPATPDALAERLGFDARATRILLRLLAALGLLAQRKEHMHLTDHARVYLHASSPFYWGHMMRVGVNESHRSTLRAALKKKDSAMTAGPQGTPMPAGTGRSADGWAQGNIPIERAHEIAATMHAHSLLPAIGVARHYDFAGISRILDVGGGSGCFMIAMAKAHPAVRCTVLELATMCEVARGYIEAGGVADRVDTHPCDMFRHSWPTGYDAIFFSNVWHDWNVRTCTWLAGRAYEALPPGGRILLHEMLLDDDGAGPLAAASFSMLMLLATQGQQFTFGELAAILECAGFSEIVTQQTSSYYSITTGIRR
jgi:protein-L-isoaspartate O-methyltransferase